MIKDIDAFIFDMDGTLVDNMAIHTRLWVEYFAEMGITIDPRDFNQRTAGKTNPEVVRTVLGDDLSAAQLAEIGEEKERRFRAFFREHARPVAGLHALLAAARQAGLKLGVATSAPPENVTFKLGCLGLESFFDTVVHAGHIRNSKPHPEVFLTAAAQLGVPPERCLVFEDARIGVEGARRAGMPVIFVTTTLTAQEGTQIAGVIRAVTDFTQVMDLFT